MKLYLSAVLIAALAVPAFCQMPPATPKAITLADQADQMARAAEKMAAQADVMSSDKIAAIEAQADALQAQAEKMTTQFDFSKFDSADFNYKMDEKMAMAAEKAAEAAERFYSLGDIDAKLNQNMNLQFDSKFNFDVDSAMSKVADQLAFLQGPTPKPFPAPEAPGAPPAPKAKIFFGNVRGDGGYDAGYNAINQNDYDNAVRFFDMVINAKSSRTDGALYWKAYALNRAGKRDEALASLAQLRRDYATSAWLNDAQVLEAEVKQSNGQPISPAQEGNDDLKLLAINSLMNADAERAIPLIEGILKSNGTPRLKDKALFVLVQSKSPKAQQILADYAKGGGNPDLQLHAIQYVGMSRTKESQQLLVSIYGTSSDARAKNQILQSLMGERATDALLNIAKTEKDANLRNSAIRNLANDRSVSVDSLVELYGSTDSQGKRSIADGLSGRREAKALIDLARKEGDPAIKKYLVERIGDMRGNKDAMDYMIELLK